MTKMVTNLTKGKGITDNPGKPISWKGNINPSIVPNLNDCCEQEELKKKSFGRSHHVDMQQRCSLLNKKLKKKRSKVWSISKALDLRELSSIPDVVIPLKLKCQNLKSTMEPNALRIIWPRIITR